MITFRTASLRLLQNRIEVCHRWPSKAGIREFWLAAGELQIFCPFSSAFNQTN